MRARVVHRPVDGQEDVPWDLLEGSLDTDEALDFDVQPERRNTMPSKKAAAAPAEEKAVEKKDEKKAESNQITAADVAKEFGLSGRQLRIFLRSKGYARGEGRWAWDPKSSDLAKLRKELTARAEEAKKEEAAEKPAAKK